MPVASFRHRLENTNINMQPQFVIVTDISNLVDWVKWAKNRRSTRDTHEERNASTAFRFFDLLFEILGNHAATNNHWYGCQ